MVCRVSVSAHVNVDDSATPEVSLWRTRSNHGPELRDGAHHRSVVPCGRGSSLVPTGPAGGCTHAPHQARRQLHGKTRGTAKYENLGLITLNLKETLVFQTFFKAN